MGHYQIREIRKFREFFSSRKFLPAKICPNKVFILKFNKKSKPAIIVIFKDFFFVLILICFTNFSGIASKEITAKEYANVKLEESSFQRVFNYLSLYETNKAALNNYDYHHENVHLDAKNLLRVLLR